MARKYHFACNVNEDGDVAALCFRRPRAINLRVASWTIRTEAVTCPRCRARLEGLRIAEAVRHASEEYAEASAP